MYKISEINKIKKYIDTAIPNNNISNLDIFNNLTNDSYYVKIISHVILKISTKNNFHFVSLSNEIKLNKLTAQYNKVPQMLYSYVSECFAIKVEQVIEGRVLAINRDDFNLSRIIRKMDVIKCIEKISNITIPINVVVPIYDTQDKMLTYLYDNQLANVLNCSTIESCKKIVSNLKQEGVGLSHGDLLPSNIICTKQKQLYFIDWEWCGIRSVTYDKVFFLLFSGVPNYMVSKIKNYFPDECRYSAYIDVILIALREIKNWLKINDNVEVKKKRINMWLSVLGKGIDYIEIIDSKI